MSTWLLLIQKLPAEPTSRRVYVWRKLKRLGAILLHDAAWALPATARTREQFQWLAGEIEEMGGEAFVWESTLAYGQEESLVRQFQAQVDDAYRELLTELEKDAVDLSALSRRYQQIRMQDYFESAWGKQLYVALARIREDGLKKHHNEVK